MNGKRGRPPLSETEIAAGYRAMSAEGERQGEALERAEALLQDIGGSADLDSNPKQPETA